MSELYGRKYTVTVDTIQTSALDVKFRAIKTLEPEPNTCDLIIYNLNPQHRQQLASVAGGPMTEIAAGYEANSGRVYSGQLREVISYKVNTDWVTELHSGDGEDRLGKARTNRSYAAGTQVDVIIKDAIGDLGLGIGNSVKALLSGTLAEAGREFLKGITVSGSSTKKLNKLLNSIGKEWSIQDGEVQIIDKGVALPGPAVRIDKDSGLIGSPTIGNDGILKFRSLMNHVLVPGRALEVESEEVSKAFYRAERCEYIGESAGNDWFVDVEATLYVAALVFL